MSSSTADEIPMIKNSNTLFVGGISWRAKEEDLAKYFTQFGEVVECKIIMDRETKQSKGYGFVTFKDAKAVSAVKSSSSLTFMNKNMNVGDAVRKNKLYSPQIQSSNIIYPDHSIGEDNEDSLINKAQINSPMLLSEQSTPGLTSSIYPYSLNTGNIYNTGGGEYHHLHHHHILPGSYQQGAGGGGYYIVTSGSAAAPNTKDLNHNGNSSNNNNNSSNNSVSIHPENNYSSSGAPPPPPSYYYYYDHGATYQIPIYPNTLVQNTNNPNPHWVSYPYIYNVYPQQYPNAEPQKPHSPQPHPTTNSK